MKKNNKKVSAKKTNVKKVKVKKSNVKLFAPPTTGPKVLIYDVETMPLLGYVWSIWEQNVALNQIHTDWCILSWSAKWLGAPDTDVMYMDQRNSNNLENDKPLLTEIWKLLDQADIVITQNGKSFDEKKLNARFIINGFQPPASYKHIDTKQIASKKFGFTSNKLEYMTDKLCTNFKKSQHKKFPGFELWRECLKGNKEAFQEMEEYNKYDVLSLEELYNKLIVWDDQINFNLYHDNEDHICKCGSNSFSKNGFYYTSAGRFQKHKCKSCGSEHRDKENLFSKEKRKSLKTTTN